MTDWRRLAWHGAGGSIGMPFGYWLVEGTLPSPELAAKFALYYIAGFMTVMLVRSRF